MTIPISSEPFNTVEHLGHGIKDVRFILIDMTTLFRVQLDGFIAITNTAREIGMSSFKVDIYDYTSNEKKWEYWLVGDPMAITTFSLIYKKEIVKIVDQKEMNYAMSEVNTLKTQHPGASIDSMYFLARVLMKEVAYLGTRTQAVMIMNWAEQK